MMVRALLLSIAVIVWGCHVTESAVPGVAEGEGAMVLFDFEGDFDIGKVKTNGDAKVSLSESEGGKALRIATGGKEQRAGVTLRAPGRRWDLSKYVYVAMDVRNAGREDVMVNCRVDDEQWVDGCAVVPAGERRMLTVLLKRDSLSKELSKYLFGMNGMPGGHVWIWAPVYPARTRELVISVAKGKCAQVVEIDNIRAVGSYDVPTIEELESSYFPFIDAYGQYNKKDWPGKTHSAEDFEKAKKEEAADLEEHPGPSDWNKYGGWASGPKLEATEHFRVEKYQGKWWLVDPEGRLFWSHGIDCVNMRFGSTPVSDRERYFEKLPDPKSEMGKFYQMGRGAAHGYYKERSSYKSYDFGRANLLRKYGEDWQEEFGEVSHKRLRSWGMNTIANWSAPPIYLMRKTPYVVTIGTGGRRIEGAKGHWRKFPDPFAASFHNGLTQRLTMVEKNKNRTTDDPWCIGYFVDNEMTWGNEVYLATGCLESPADQPAKKAFIEQLKAKYEDIRKLNAYWGTKYGSWEALLESKAKPLGTNADADLKAFSVKIAEKYFQEVRDAIKEAAPKKLYLGCRFDFHFYPEEDKQREWVIYAAAKYCDVISFNRYRFSAGTLVPPGGIDKPVIVGEFHFGALDRGMFHTGLRSVTDQTQRGEMYISYVQSALENPYMIGTHWFQYGDQATTGRTDGENYQVGFIDICDTPYPETVKACREIGYKLYEYRMGK